MPMCRATRRTHQVSIEVAGRHARQRFFREAIASVKADRIAVAHTRDDQAETVILRLAAARDRAASRRSRRGAITWFVRCSTRARRAAGFPARAERDVARGCDQSRSRHSAESHPPRRDAASCAPSTRKPTRRWRAPPRSCAATKNFSSGLPTRRFSGASKLMASRRR